MEKEMEKEDMEWDGKAQGPPVKRPRARAIEDSDSEKHPKLKQTDTTLSTTPIPFPDIENPDYDSVSNILTLLDPSSFGYPYPPIPFPNMTPFRGRLAGFKFKGVMNTNEVVDMEEDDEEAPPPTPSYVKLSDDTSLLQKLLAAQSSSLSQHHSHSDLTLIKSAAALLVFKHTLPNTNKNIWNIIRADGFELFIRVIITASSLVYKLYSKDSLFLIASKGTGSEQIETLWKDIQWMHQDQLLPFSKVCKEVVRLVAENDDYSSITEPQVDFMTNHFRWLFCDDVKRPADRDADPYTYPIQACDPFAYEDKDGVMRQITTVLTCMEYPFEKEDEDRTSWLVRFFREDDERDELVDKAMHFVKVANLDYNKTRHIRAMLGRIIHHAKELMKFKLIDVKQPLLALHRSASLDLHPEISDIVEVAEIRRMDLGNCFIGRSHLLWAFYELGYGLHVKVRDQIEVHADEDHPPYHIYFAAFKLTQLLGESTTQLDHFIFVAIHSKNIGYDGEKIVNFLKTFKDLRERHEFIEGAPSPRQ